jgi:hypothetical protein
LTKDQKGKGSSDYESLLFIGYYASFVNLRKLEIPRIRETPIKSGFFIHKSASCYGTIA